MAAAAAEAAAVGLGAWGLDGQGTHLPHQLDHFDDVHRVVEPGGGDQLVDGEQRTGPAAPGAAVHPEVPIWAQKSDRKPLSASDRPGHEAEHITRRV